MRTTLNIDDDLLKEAKIAAIREGITLTEYVERALRHERGGGAQDVRRTRWKPLSFPGEMNPPAGFDWTWSYSKMIEFLEGPDARP